MAEDANTGENKDANTGENKDASTAAIAKKKNRSKGFISKIWNGLFRLHGDDFEKRLQHISKEEAAVLARMQRRASSWRKMARNLIVLSVLFEGIAVCYAILTTRSLDLDWKMRAFRVLPMFLLPALSTLTYSAYGSFIRICDRKDQKTLERLRAERQAKINELKEKTNYYSTQQLIQRYDTDPAAKAAAATVLASKLGADSGLKLFMEDNTKPNFSTGKSNDVEPMQSTGLRKRKQLSSTPSGSESTISHQSKVGALHDPAAEIHASSSHNSPPVVEHYSQGGTMHDGGWLARIAALLVGEDPTQSYALICGNCHRHNGLARKEDFPYITYYCPHCSALNRSKQMEESTPPALIDSTSHKTSLPSAASPEAASPVADLTTLTSTASEIVAQESREERPATEIPETEKE